MKFRMIENNGSQVKNLSEWEYLLNKLFPIAIPERCSWNNIKNIINILNIIGSIDNSNHTFLPQGGGLDLTGASGSMEESCIELNFGGMPDIIKPKSLFFESFGPKTEWAYFRLETCELEPSPISATNGIYQYNNASSEELTELESGMYIERSAWDNRYYYAEDEEKNIPKTARLIKRVLNGSYVTFAKTSPYNRNPDTYDGRHNLTTLDEFRNQIGNIMNLVHSTI